MYSLHLSAEQLEIRDTVREFVAQEIKPVMLKADRLDVRDRSLPPALLDKASQMGLRTLALSEKLGGAGADSLTSCIVTEELAAGDADIAGAMTETSRLAHLLFDLAMNDAQRDRHLPKFLQDDRFHLALANHEPGSDTRLGVNYHRPVSAETPIKTTAKKSGNDWIINGRKDCVANAPIAKLFAVEVAIDGQSAVMLVLSDAPGLKVHAHEKPWHHGPCGDIELKDCRVPADNLLADNASALLRAQGAGRGNPLFQALNLGIGRAAYEAAVEYAQLRVQGARRIIEHQAIGTKLADVAVRLEVARAAVWQAAWASDHPEAYGDRSLSDLPLQTVAEVFTGQAVLQAVKDAVEVFGAMGVMRDMPLQKYVNDARVCLHSGDGASEAKLRIAEAIAGFRRPSKTINGGSAAAAE